MPDVDEAKILNIIADIRSGQERLNTIDADITRLEIELEVERDDQESTRTDLANLRQELDDYLDTIIPDQHNERSLNSLVQDRDYHEPW